MHSPDLLCAWCSLRAAPLTLGPLVPLRAAEKDWEDIRFGVENKVDFYALSFVKDAQVVWQLKDFLKGQSAAHGGE